MTKVSVCIDLDEQRFRCYEREAQRRGTTIEDLLRQSIALMFRDQEERLRDEEEGHPIEFS